MAIPKKTKTPDPPTKCKKGGSLACYNQGFQKGHLMGWHEATVHFEKLMKQAEKKTAARKVARKGTNKAKKAAKKPRRR